VDVDGISLDMNTSGTEEERRADPGEEETLHWRC
jgi:hypothetical protein